MIARGRILVGLALVCSCSGIPEFGETGHWPTPPKGAVASEHPLATQVGLDLLDAGGNAADAAVGVALALAVVYPRAGNLGGGGFALFVPHDADDEDGLRALDFRETAPRALRSEHFLVEGELDRGLALQSRLSVGVPGSPYGLHLFHAEFGRLPFARVAQPAIDLARDGFLLNAWDARQLAEARDKLAVSPAARRVFFGASGKTKREGERLVQPELARTLQILARSGPKGFYQGDVARSVVDELSRGLAQGSSAQVRGVLDGVDLLDYEPIWREPLRGWFGGMEILTMPPPSSGGIVLLEVLAILDGFPLAVERVRGPRGWHPTSRALHWWIEAMRVAFAERAEHLGDPAFHDVPLEELLSLEWIHTRRVGIGERANPDVTAWELDGARSGAGASAESQPLGGHETTHISVLDVFGNAVSLTTTLNSSFGSGIVVEGAGFLLNNEMDDFALQPGVPNVYGLVGAAANRLEGGRRPLSSMSPTVVRDGGHSVALILGSPGGPKIITSVLQVVLRVLAYEQGLAAAMAAPRLHQQWAPSTTSVEPGWDDATLDGLRRRGHTLVPVTRTLGSIQAIYVPQPGAEPVARSDSRRGGVAGVQGRALGPPAEPPADGAESVLIGQ